MPFRNSDAVLFLTDADSGITPADHEVARILRKYQRDVDGQSRPPVILVVNKCENESRRMAALEFYELGLGEPYPISALHGTGTGDMLDALVATFKKEGEEIEDDSIKIAIVGKPNAGKSSLLNQLLGEERAIVSPIPGTTRDAIDTRLTYADIPILLIDTAGIRRRGHIMPGVEQYSVLRSLQAIERSDVVLLVLDATAGLTAQDAHIAGFILDEWKSCVVLVNKWDAVEKDTYTMDEFTQTIRQELEFYGLCSDPVHLSQDRSAGRPGFIPGIKVQEERLTRLPTSRINRIIQHAQDRHAAPSHAGAELKIYYGTQVRNDPPVFLLHVNDPKLAHFTYLRYLGKLYSQGACIFRNPHPHRFTAAQEINKHGL